MSRTLIPTYTTSQVIDAAHANTYWRDNETAHWSAISALAGCFELIEKIILPSAGQFRFLAIPQTYSHLRLYWHLRSNGSSADSYVNICMAYNQFGGTGGGLYNTTIMRADSAGSVIHVPGGGYLWAGITANKVSGSRLWTNGYMTIYDYSKKVRKVTTAFNACKRGTTSALIALDKGTSIWSKTYPVITITIFPQDYGSNDFIAGSTMWLYGLS